MPLSSLLVAPGNIVTKFPTRQLRHGCRGLIGSRPEINGLQQWRILSFCNYTTERVTASREERSATDDPAKRGTVSERNTVHDYQAGTSEATIRHVFPHCDVEQRAKGSLQDPWHTLSERGRLGHDVVAEAKTGGLLRPVRCLKRQSGLGKKPSGVGGQSLAGNKDRTPNPSLTQPSQLLIAVLSAIGKSRYLIRNLGSFAPALPQKIQNIDWADASSLEEYSSLEAQFGFVRDRKQRRFLQSILARFILKDHFGKHAEASVFDEDELLGLHARGYDVRHVKLWADILRMERSDDAARLLTAHEEDVPLFVVLLFLHRTDISPNALRMVLAHVSRWTRPRHEASGEARTPASHMDGSSFFILIVRLLRQARMVLPAAFVEIAEVFTAYALQHLKVSKTSRNSPELQASRLSQRFNRILMLLSLPPHISPKKSSAIQEKAQLTVLQSMTKHDPPLIVSQEGYLALARVQLARGKTAREREWALLKAKSWPPWKEDRTAMDSDKGVDYGTSRPDHIIKRMMEAGYPKSSSEKVISLYGGWDTDGSPTIQYRVTIDRPVTKFSRDEQTSLWAARVRATRTKREAWACFLEYEKSGSCPKQDVYLAMFEKIDERKQVVLADLRSPYTPIPGDGKEVFPEPSSTHELVYVERQVPTFEQLFEQMVEKGVKPSGRLLAYLLEATTTWQFGFEVLRSNPNAYGSNLGRLMSSPLGTVNQINGLPPYFYASLIRMLCKRAYLSRQPITMSALLCPNPHLSIEHQHPLVYAYHLLNHVELRYVPAWKAFFECLKPSPSSVLDRLEGSQEANKILEWQLMQRMIAKMQELGISMDGETFSMVCNKLQDTAWASFKLASDDAEAGRVLTDGALYIRKLFQSVTGGSTDAAGHDTRRDVPRLTVVPSPSEIHSYIRALGFLKDHEGLYSLVCWMAEHQQELREASEEKRNGPVAFRRALCAMRAFLEQTWEGLQSEERASDELIELVKEKIEDVPAWGGWPEDHEVEYYCQNGSLRWLKKDVRSL